jgi:hypothetical protein
MMFLKKSNKTMEKRLKYPKLEHASTRDYDDVFTGKLDYLIIQDFISKDELKNFHQKISLLHSENKSILENKKTGFFLGKSILGSKDLSEYFEIAKTYNKTEPEILGFSFVERLKSILNKISVASSVQIPVSASGKDYLGSSIRILEPDKAAFPAHTDKYVHDIAEEARELNSMISSENIISFFAVLKNPEKGGRLFLFNKLYKDTSPDILNNLTSGDFSEVQKYIYKHEALEVPLKEGDLILFDAGQRWHLVEPIYGTRQRITVGCFTSYNKKKDTIYLWS